MKSSLHHLPTFRLSIIILLIVIASPSHVLTQTTPSALDSSSTVGTTTADTGTVGMLTTTNPPQTTLARPPDWPEEEKPVTKLELAGTTVELCTHRHLCGSLGCHFQPFEDFNRTGAAPLCQCDPDCVFFNDCCQDYKESCEHVTDDDQGTVSKLRKLKLEDLTCYPGNTKKGYFAIASCPEERQSVSDEMLFLCENVDSNDLLSTILVSGVKYNLPYRNVYCALCHGEDLVDLTSWSLDVDCFGEHTTKEALGLLSNSTSSETLDYLQNTLDCTVRPKPQDPTLNILRACFIVFFESCPAGHPLSEACESYTAFVHTALPFDYLESKNPHCVACNNDVENATECESFYPYIPLKGVTPQPGLGAPPDGGVPPISIVLDFRSGGNVKLLREETVVVEEQVACSTNEVYDPFRTICRKLSCSFGYELVGNECVLKSEHDDDGIVVYIHVTVCTSEPLGYASEEAVRNCLQELIKVNQSKLEESTIPLGTPMATCFQNEQQTTHPYMVQTDRKTFQEFHVNLQEPRGVTFCQTQIDAMKIVAMEVIHHTANLAVGKCNGRWITEAQFHTDGSGLVYINESDSWYAANQTLQREDFIHEELSSELKQSGSLQLCLNPDLSCLLETFNSSLFLQDDLNNILTYIPTGEMYSRDQYIETWSGQIQVCSFSDRNGTRNTTRIITFFEYSQPQQILSLILNIISMLAALITFITYCVFKELRNHTGYLIMSFVGTLFMAQLFLLFSGVATIHPSVCTTVAVLAHYLLLVNVMWTGLLAFDLHQTFATRSKVRQSKHGSIPKAAVSIAWGTPILIILPCLILHLCDCTEIPLWYGDENICWIGNGYVNIAVVGGPIGVVISANVILFAFTIHGIWRTNRDTITVRKNKSLIQQTKEELIIYLKISSLMGFTWIIGFTAAFTDVILLWYIFIILNSCQGLLVFLSFVCKISIWRRWKKTFALRCCRREDHQAHSSNMSQGSSPSRPTVSGDTRITRI
ncbi:uncharacterized protein [Asterias amurensis]|uniref:uncharacterized protein n=1 Tax=Asterias amurensis TaxID=7602 RepID=UPI003AB7BD4F